MFNLIPRDTVFYDLFEGLAQRSVSAANHLRTLANNFPRVDESIQRIRTEEHDSDDLAHQALERLDRCFITPFDREDIHMLINGLDDIVDEIDALAKRFSLYSVKAMDPEFVKQTEVLVQSTVGVHTAVSLLRKSRKLTDLQPTLIEIGRLENLGDENNHAAVRRLFAGDIPALEVMKWKEFFDRVEKAIDKCEDVGNTLERIVLKNG